MHMGLQTYHRKRNFTRTAEPKGVAARRNHHRFVVHEHHASHLHYDFRLEAGGVLKSWAIPKGISLDPRQKRLAVRVEDHPVEYLHFAGHIAEGNYGAGEVTIWDTGHYELVTPGDPVEQIESGKVSLLLQGQKLHGAFHLIRMGGKTPQWLLMKGNDAFAAWQSTDLHTPVSGEEREPRPSQAQRLAPLPGAQRAPMPRTVIPMLATLVNRAFSHPEWLFETKWDGVRALCFLTPGQTRFVSRNEKEISVRYPELADLSAFVKAETAVLDGEIVALDRQGRPSFQLLQSRVGLKNTTAIARLAREQPATYCVFDLLYYNGWDLRSVALIERKTLLKKILTGGPPLRYSEHVLSEGEQYYKQAKATGLEGIIAKRHHSTYVSHRSSEWLKMKTVQQQEVVIGGYTDPRGARPYFGALTVGLYRAGNLHYVGHVGGGFTQHTLEQVYGVMQPLNTDQAPFVEVPRTNEPVHWLRPELVCEVKFAEWTAERRLRQPIFLGLRDDKDATQCTFESARPVEQAVQAAESPRRHRHAQGKAGKSASLTSMVRAKALHGDMTVRVEKQRVSLTHLDKLYWPDDGYTKGDLLRYYGEVAPSLLPYLKDRPLILMRYPNGITAPSFYQHDVDVVPAFVQTFSTTTEAGKVVDYIVGENLATLLYVVNLGTIAQNPWLSRVPTPDCPDWIVFDLDPHDVPFAAVQEMALRLKALLDRLRLVSYPKTSGASGIHVYVPIAPLYPYAQVAHFAELVAVVATRENPRLATLERSLKKREAGRIYLDHLQNARGKSVVAPYSVRAQAGAPVSTPLEWQELQHPLSPHDFTLKNIPQRLRLHGDLFKRVLTHKQRLGDALEELERLLRAPTDKKTRRPKKSTPRKTPSSAGASP
jgi:bifunctional non-homologous end joining protein LigD